MTLAATTPRAKPPAAADPPMPEPDPSTPGEFAPFERRHLLVLLLVTGLAAALRLTAMGKWSLWVDEAHTYRDVAMPLSDFWNGTVSYYPMSYLLLRGALEYLPESEWGLRLPFVFFGMATVPALALAARGMVGRVPALLAAALLALSPWHLYWSQNARSYSMLLFFCVLGLGAVHRGHVRHSLAMTLAGIGSLLVAGFCHPSAFFLLAAVAAFGLLDWLLRRSKSPRGRWFPLLAVAMVMAAAPFMWDLLQHYGKVKRAEVSILHLPQTMVFFVGVPALVGAAGGALVLWARNPRTASFLVASITLPLLVLGLLGAFGFKVTAQYAFYTLPAFFILLAVLLVEVTSPFRKPGWRFGLLRMVPAGMLLFGMAADDYLYFTKHHGWRNRWREASELVSRDSGQQERRRYRVLTTNGPSMTYYLDRGVMAPARSSKPGVRVMALGAWWFAQEPDLLERQRRQAIAAGETLYAVVTAPELAEMDPTGAAMTFLRRQMRQVGHFTNWIGPKDMTVHVFVDDGG